MALRLLESFDHADATYYALKYPQWWGVIDPAGRNGSCVKAAVGWPGIKAVFADNQQTWISGFAWKRPFAGTYFLALTDGITPQLQLWYDANAFSFEVYRGGALLGQSAPGLVLPNTWYYLEFKAYIHAALGSFELRLDGVNICSAANVNTQQTANAYANQIWALGQFDNYLDDWYLGDGAGAINIDFLGDLKIIRRKPNAAGTYSEWTPSAGANWQNVAENTPDGDATYNETDTVGARDTYNFEDVTLTGSIKGVQLNLCHRKTDAGTRKVKPLCRSGAADFQGSEDSLDDTYRYNKPGAIYETDPATGLPWTIANLNAAEFGQILTV
jgi:hypothetical protein